MSPYIIRSGQPDDAAALLAIHRSSILGLTEPHYSAQEAASWAAKLSPEGYVRTMTKGGETFAVATTERGQGIGFCSYKENEVVGLYVKPSWARKGVGTALLHHAEAAIAAAGHQSVTVMASLSGRAFYEAHGYQVIKKRGWETRGGLVIDALDMLKRC